MRTRSAKYVFGIKTHIPVFCMHAHFELGWKAVGGFTRTRNRKIQVELLGYFNTNNSRGTQRGASGRKKFCQTAPQKATEKGEGCLDGTGSVATQDLEACGMASVVFTAEISEVLSTRPW